MSSEPKYTNVPANKKLSMNMLRGARFLPSAEARHLEQWARRRHRLITNFQAIGLTDAQIDQVLELARQAVHRSGGFITYLGALEDILQSAQRKETAELQELLQELSQ